MKVEVKEVVTRVDIETNNLKINDIKAYNIHDMSYVSPYTSYGLHGQVVSTGGGHLSLTFNDDEIGLVTMTIEPKNKLQEENTGKAWLALEKYLVRSVQK